MNNEFIEKMEEDEKLLYHGKANVNETSMQLFRFILVFVVLAGFWLLVNLGMKNEGGLTLKGVVMYVFLSIITLAIIYAFIHNTLLKHAKNNNEYFVTNKRVAVYNPKNGLKEGYIENIEHLGINREKSNYGNIVLNFKGSNLLEQIKSSITFDGIENPRRITQIIIDINENIHVYDDRPTVMGKKFNDKQNEFK